MSARATAMLKSAGYSQPVQVGDVKVGSVHESDPKADILNEVGFLTDQLECTGSKLLVAIYQRPEMTSGGIVIPGSKEEDTYQGKIGLVIKMGPLAFLEDENHQWGSVKAKVGDWVQYRVGDTFPFRLGRDKRSRSFRYVEDVNILAIWKRPDLVW